MKLFKDKKRFYEMELFELETERIWNKKYSYFFLGIMAFCCISFWIGQIWSWRLMDSSGFIMLLMFMGLMMVLNNSYWISFYEYQKKKEQGLL